MIEDEQGPEQWLRVGEAIRLAMEEQSLTKADVIRMSKVTRPTLNGYLSGRPVRNVRKLYDLCKALGWTAGSISEIRRGGDPALLTVRSTPVPAPRAAAVSRPHAAAPVSTSADLILHPTLGDMLNLKKAESGLTYRQLDSVLGATANAINRWHEDKASPSAPHFAKLMEYLGVDLDGLGGLVLASELRRYRQNQRI